MNTENNQDAVRVNLNPYLDWVQNEGIPVVEDFGVDLFDTPTRPWARFGVNGAAVHLIGRGDFVSMFLLDMPPGAATSPQRHLYEEVIFVLEGRGSTVIEAADGSKHSFEWGPRSLFAIPLNASYRHFNGSGVDRALMISTTNLPVMINLFHNESFVFQNPSRFEERTGDPKYFLGDGDLIPQPGGRDIWETNFVADLSVVTLKEWVARGKGSKNIRFQLADGTLHAHISEIAVGRYKKAHRHPADFHVMCVTGSGYSLFWYEGDADFTRVNWKYGTVFAPPDQMFHQHFNLSAEPARYLATAMGNLRYPFTESKRRALFGGVSTSLKLGGDQIEHEDQSERIHSFYVEEARKAGVTVTMPDFA
jgi:uncharacterized RmlC-like cupin family protein